MRERERNIRGTVSELPKFLRFRSNITEKFGAGDEDRTRNFQLGNLNYHSFIFTTYKTAREKSICMHCIPCMQCLTCVSLGDVWGTVCRLKFR